KTLVEDPDARIQWAFASRNVEALLLEWAHARGETGETLSRAMDVMLQPRPGGPHDDHLHIRTACSPAEIVAGCEHTGPVRPWIEALDRDAGHTASDWELADALFRPAGGELGPRAPSPRSGEPTAHLVPTSTANDEHADRR
ncbi:MAG: hypothetical protein J0I07_31185, partial [Myxococcales bacterium]|nr:hypothetical protein [Myxococcales bacterium]